MQNKEWLVIEKLVSLLDLYHQLTKIMSYKYANSLLIIPQIMALKATLSRQDTKNMLHGIGQTVTKLQTQMTTRYQAYLDNPNLMIATYVDPR